MLPAARHNHGRTVLDNDDWSGIADPAERRRRQNRLHQRLYRQRMASIGQRSRKSIAPSIPDNRDAQASAQACCSKATGDNDAATGARQSEFTSTSIQKHALEKNPNPSALAAMHERGICIRNTRPSEIAKAMAVFEAQARFSHAMALPRGDQLLTLIQFNVLRALFSNTRSLGFGLEWLSPESQSPFTTKSIPDELQIAAVDLRPSRLQMAVLHHPWIDLLPSATMRDNILRAMDTFDEDDLCNDLVDFDGVANEKTGLIAWDTPWRAFGFHGGPLVGKSAQRFWKSGHGFSKVATT